MSQTQSILSHLASGMPLSAAQAYRQYGCLRLAARVLELRQRGYSVKSERVGRGGRFWASYTMASGQHRL